MYISATATLVQIKDRPKHVDYNEITSFINLIFSEVGDRLKIVSLLKAGRQFRKAFFNGDLLYIPKDLSVSL